MTSRRAMRGSARVRRRDRSARDSRPGRCATLRRHPPPTRCSRERAADGPAELLVRQREVLPRFADEDAGGVDAVGERAFAVDEQDAKPARGEEAGAVKAGEAGADDGGVEFHKELYNIK